MVEPKGIIIDKLGVFDVDGDGLAEDHPIALWDAQGQLLASATVPSGELAPLDASGLFRLIDIPQISINAGQGYVVGAYFSAGLDNFDATVLDFATNPSISYGQSRYSLDVSQLEFPTQYLSFRDPGYFGPSFEVVPEPSALAILAGLSIRRRR